MLLARDDHEQQEEPVEGDVARGEHHCARPQERVTPEEAEPARDLGAQAAGRPRARLLERRVHRDHRRDGEDVRDAVARERQHARDSEQQSAEQRPGQHGGEAARTVARHRLGQLRPGHDLSDRARLRDVEERVERPLQERDDRDLRVAQEAAGVRHDEARGRDRAAGVGDDHHVLAVQPVDQYTRRTAGARRTRRHRPSRPSA